MTVINYTMSSSTRTQRMDILHFVTHRGNQDTRSWRIHLVKWNITVKPHASVHRRYCNVSNQFIEPSITWPKTKMTVLVSNFQKFVEQFSIWETNVHRGHQSLTVDIGHWTLDIEIQRRWRRARTYRAWLGHRRVDLLRLRTAIWGRASTGKYREIYGWP